MKELERKIEGNMIYRIARDMNGFLCHQFKNVNEEENPSYNDGWTTDFMSACCLTVNRPYPYNAPSCYYLRRSMGMSIEEALAE